MKPMQGKMGTRGFTLTELLIAIVIGSLVIGSLLSLFIGQTNFQSDQHERIMLQQNGRAALNVISNDILTSGYSPVKTTIRTNANIDAQTQAGIVSASIDSIQFTRDIDWDQAVDGVNETITYSLNEERKIERITGDDPDNPQPILDNVEAFRLLYAYDTESLGATGYGQLEVDGTSWRWAIDCDENGYFDRYYTFGPDGMTVDDMNTENVPISRARAVQLWILTRSESGIKTGVPGNTQFSIPACDDEASGRDDRYMYKLFTTTIKLRNMYY